MIEVFNARDILTGEDFGLIEKACQLGAVPVAASDAHLKVEVGRSYVSIEAFDDAESFLKNLQNLMSVKRKSPFWVHLVTKVLKLYRKKRGNIIKCSLFSVEIKGLSFLALQYP